MISIKIIFTGNAMKCILLGFNDGMSTLIQVMNCSALGNWPLSEPTLIKIYDIL